MEVALPLDPGAHLLNDTLEDLVGDLAGLAVWQWASRGEYREVTDVAGGCAAATARAAGRRQGRAREQGGGGATTG